MLDFICRLYKKGGVKNLFFNSFLPFSLAFSRTSMAVLTFMPRKNTNLKMSFT
ncbi:hypothetical exported protein [Syntrophus aciditrophicus SB]|uniref:Hypothetical exported protein n=1 Tax=Syntrophus aciditrophicus (strain SB) TaxID=56780 RepID=Q2LW44_SYNAS|nr:hypothetical exported protein [Syntrophus aciditrophicus SB]